MLKSMQQSQCSQLFLRWQGDRLAADRLLIKTGLGASAAQGAGMDGQTGGRSRR